ncbi:unnamed protein product [Cyprideis torosa]|uniref:Uncharacterized protein n=1 Tax=Cyprideis torosa TaxID=163714 RepID=A0A7R8WPG2_9CRUS|nr:unnamed protein product [Cyprideis torosa]CAG0901252.1 unnamed protein product [Cyprideis torosa]
MGSVRTSTPVAPLNFYTCRPSSTVLGSVRTSTPVAPLNFYTCRPSSTVLGYTCECTSQFTGPHCSEGTRFPSTQERRQDSTSLTSEEGKPTIAVQPVLTGFSTETEKRLRRSRRRTELGSWQF